MTAKQADMMKELTAILARHGNVDVYQGDMVPVFSRYFTNTDPCLLDTRKIADDRRLPFNIFGT